MSSLARALLSLSAWARALLSLSAWGKQNKANTEALLRALNPKWHKI
jgi:hypothetical protein